MTNEFFSDTTHSRLVVRSDRTYLRPADSPQDFLIWPPVRREFSLHGRESDNVSRFASQTRDNSLVTVYTFFL